MGIGDYKITEFFVVDVNNKAIYTTPLEGAPFAYLITDPLPINFTITKDQVSKVVPEVLSTDCQCLANDFGYSSFDFVIITPLCFLINVQVYNPVSGNWEITTADITVKGDLTNIYTGSVAAKTDSIKIRDNYTNYTLSISKTGYQTKDSILTSIQLKEFLNKPILFLLKQTEAETVIDIDGNIYHTVKIGTQVWMLENLKVTRYRNGDPITNITDDIAWKASTKEAYCWYMNDITYGQVYGALYNWYAVSDNRKICPIGWHIPSLTEWTTLSNYLGSTAGGKMKEVGNNHWSNGNYGADNSSGFTGLPGGYRYNSSGLLGSVAYFWSATEANISTAWSCYLSNANTNLIILNLPNQEGMSVRCVKD